MRAVAALRSNDRRHRSTLQASPGRAAALPTACETTGSPQDRIRKKPQPRGNARNHWAPGEEERPPGTLAYEVSPTPRSAARVQPTPTGSWLDHHGLTAATPLEGLGHLGAWALGSITASSASTAALYNEEQC